MRETKRCIAQFTFYDRTGIQAFLEKRALEGWMLEKISPLGWKFRRTEPKQVHFAVTYFHKASAFDPEPTEGQRIFQEYCAHTGWRLVDINGPMQIFCNESEDPLPIETDPVTELAAIHASAKKNFLPSFIMLLVVAIMNIALQIGQLASFPLTYLSQNATIFNWIVQLCLLTMCCQEVFGYFLWHRRAKKAAAETGSFVETKGHRKLHLTLLAIVATALIWLLSTMEAAFSTAMAVTLAGTFGLYGIVFGIKEVLKRFKARREVNRAVTIGTTVVLTFALTAAMGYALVHLVQADFWVEEENVETYEAGGLIWELHHDALPLYVEDLRETDYDKYSCKWDAEESVLISTYKGVQSARVMENALEISYEIYEIHLPILYEMCKKELFFWYDDWLSEDIYGNVIKDEYRAVDALPWGAQEVYRLYSATHAYDWYLLCYEDRFVTVKFDWDVTDAQKAVVGEKLGK